MKAEEETRNKTITEHQRLHHISNECRIASRQELACEKFSPPSSILQYYEQYGPLSIVISHSQYTEQF
jgi:hypothetical protein